MTNMISHSMEKYAPGRHAGKFQNFIISKWGIEANSEKI